MSNLYKKIQNKDNNNLKKSFGFRDVKGENVENSTVATAAAAAAHPGKDHCMDVRLATQVEVAMASKIANASRSRLAKKKVHLKRLEKNIIATSPS